jgi:hypothetical protein
MEWISVEDALPEPGEVVITFRPMAEASGDEVYTVQKFIGKNYGTDKCMGRGSAWPIHVVVRRDFSSI